MLPLPIKYVHKYNIYHIYICIHAGMHVYNVRVSDVHIQMFEHMYKRDTSCDIHLHWIYL